MISNDRRSESGNALFYILTAIILLAAVSYAVSRSNRDISGNLSEDRTRMLATEIIDYTDTVKQAWAKLRLSGVAIESLSFAHPNDIMNNYGPYGAHPASEIFNPAGGGVIFKPPPADALDESSPQFAMGQDYWYGTDSQILDVGTTCGSNACSDMLVTAFPLKQSVCIQINKLVGIDNPGGLPPEGSGLIYGAHGGFGTGWGYSGYVLGVDDPALDMFAGKLTGCFKETYSTNSYTFYQVLQAR